MRLDKLICLGGRFNGRIIRGIKYGDYIIYPNTYSKYNIYEVVIPEDNFTVYFDTTFRVDKPYTSFYDFGDGVENPTLGTETISGIDIETGETVYKTYATYTYTTAGTYQIRTTENLYYLGSAEGSADYKPLKSVIALRSDLKDASQLLMTHENLTKFESNQKDSLDEITNTRYMFAGCRALTTVDFSDFYLPKLTDMGYMFISCDSLKTVNFSNSVLSSVENMDSIFASCDSLELANFSNCNLSKLTTLDLHYLSGNTIIDFNFNGCDFSSLTSISGAALGTGIKSLDFSNCKFTSLKNCESAFSPMTKIQSINLSNADIRNVENMAWMFADCTSLKTLKMNYVNTSNVVTMYAMFMGCENLTDLNLSSFDTSNVTNMYGMFADCKSLTELDLSNFDTSSATNMYGMFQDCTSLVKLNISNFSIGEDTNARALLMGCSALQELRLNNCDNATLTKIVGVSEFPSGIIEGVTRKIYCKEANVGELTEPEGWIFEYVD